MKSTISLQAAGKPYDFRKSIQESSLAAKIKNRFAQSGFYDYICSTKPFVRHNPLAACQHFLCPQITYLAKKVLVSGNAPRFCTNGPSSTSLGFFITKPFVMQLTATGSSGYSLPRILRKSTSEIIRHADTLALISGIAAKIKNRFAQSGFFDYICNAKIFQSGTMPPVESGIFCTSNISCRNILRRVWFRKRPQSPALETLATRSAVFLLKLQSMQLTATGSSGYSLPRILRKSTSEIIRHADTLALISGIAAKIKNRFAQSGFYDYICNAKLNNDVFVAAEPRLKARNHRAIFLPILKPFAAVISFNFCSTEINRCLVWRRDMTAVFLSVNAKLNNVMQLTATGSSGYSLPRILRKSTSEIIRHADTLALISGIAAVAMLFFASMTRAAFAAAGAMLLFLQISDSTRKGGAKW